MGQGKVLEVFQFHKVRLKVEAALQFIRAIAFQFHKVRLKGFVLRPLVDSLMHFNSIRYD